MKKILFFFCLVSFVLVLSSCRSFYFFNPSGLTYYSECFEYIDTNETFYQKNKEEYKYDYCTFIFSSENEVTINKTYDDSFVTKGTFTYKIGDVEYNLLEPTKVENSELILTLENGDILTGCTRTGYYLNRYHIELTDGIVVDSLLDEVDYPDYYNNYYKFEINEFNDMLCGKDENNVIDSCLEYKDNRNPIEFINLINAFRDQSLILVIPEFAKKDSTYSKSIKTKGEFGMPWLSFYDRNSEEIVKILYLTKPLDMIDAVLASKLEKEEFVKIEDDSNNYLYYCYNYVDENYNIELLICIESSYTLSKNDINDINFIGYYE